MIDFFNIVVAYINSCFDSTVLAPATGFFYNHNNTKYLVTNWHVVSGRNFETKKVMLSSRGIPNNIKGKFYSKSTETSLISKNFELPLLIDEKPVWFIHPKHRHDVDVVAIPLIPSTQNMGILEYICVVNDGANNLKDMQTHIGQDIFILGFPRGISKHYLPIWKRASIATEPEEKELSYYDDKPSFLVDTATKEGMSGAPVLSRSNSRIIQNGPSLQIRQGGTLPTKFLGVYSGRLGNDETQAQLGIVWKEDLIVEIIEGQIRDQFMGYSD